ncbi:MAG: hypothetical protein HZB55_22185 [Deltaproteobacteria bacterium]|nr:hypothetical protein [Deltaproteobacteria bacterium]
MARQGTESWQLCVEVLTPLHVGSGFTLLRDNDFVLREGVPFVVDLNRTLSELASGDTDLTAVVGPGARLTDLVRVCGEDYGYPLPLFGGIDADKVRGTTEVRGHLKDAFFRPCLPGSSLKGAIRTAILATAVKQAGANVQTLLPGPEHTKAQFAAQGLTEGVFSPGAPRGKTPNRDVLRALHIGDALFDVGELQLVDVRWMNLRANGWGWREMGGAKRTLDSWREANGLVSEALPPGVQASFALQVDRFLTSDPLARRTLGWETAAVGILSALTSFTSLRDLLNAYARRRLGAELSFFEVHGVGGAAAECKRLLAEMASTPEAAFVRVGWGNGWAGMTGDWMDAATVQRMRAQYRNLGKTGVPTFPKTRRLVVRGSEPCLPLGWVRLHTPEKSRKRTEALRAQAGERRAVELRQREDEERRAEERRAVERRQREEEVGREEALTRAAAAEAALLPEDRMLRELKTLIDRASPDDKKPGGPLASALNLALQGAADWPADQRHALADLAEAIWNVIGWGKAEKKTDKQSRLAKLRES